MKQEKQSEIRFDNYVDIYKQKIQETIGFAGQNVDFYIEIKAKLLRQLSEKHAGDPNRIKALDIGCGIGLIDKIAALYFQSLSGVDVEERVIERAKNNNPSIDYRIYDGRNLPFENHTFDLVFAINVIHHIPVVQWQLFLNEMSRVLKPGGIAAVFEHNPFNPLTRKVVSDCEFDRDAVLLHHGKLKELFIDACLKIIDNSYIIFFPLKGSFYRKVETLFRWLPLGAQHYVVGRKP